LHWEGEFWGRWWNCGGLSFNPTLQGHRLRGRNGTWGVFPKGFSSGGGRYGGGRSLRSNSSGPSPFEDLPSSRVLLVIRRYHYHLLTLVKGGWFSGSLSQGERNSYYRSR